jgi:hypothetical protein
VFVKAIEKEVVHAERVALDLCWYEDEHCDCREVATVHPLDPELIDVEYCERHFKAVTVADNPIASQIARAIVHLNFNEKEKAEEILFALLFDLNFKKETIYVRSAAA